jgi:hypothetical protein
MLLDALVEQRAGNDHPDGVDDDIVEPEVDGLGAAVQGVVVVHVEGVGGIVQHAAVDLAQRDDGLDGVAVRALARNQVDCEEGQGTPQELGDVLDSFSCVLAGAPGGGGFVPQSRSPCKAQRGQRSGSASPSRSTLSTAGQTGLADRPCGSG